MADVTYPGVYVDEVPAGIRQIAGVSTSTAAFVGSGGPGPCDQAIHVHALAEFGRVFGAAAETDPMRLAVQLFFANGGRDAVVVRAGGDDGSELAAVRGLEALDGVERF